MSPHLSCSVARPSRAPSTIASVATGQLSVNTDPAVDPWPMVHPPAMTSHVPIRTPPARWRFISRGRHIGLPAELAIAPGACPGPRRRPQSMQCRNPRRPSGNDEPIQYICDRRDKGKAFGVHAERHVVREQPSCGGRQDQAPRRRTGAAARGQRCHRQKRAPEQPCRTIRTAVGSHTSPPVSQPINADRSD